ncbi:GerMN domain-containing protein [Murimonas intestini]|uniref:GerMN domain-containing protein n=1 Tax=Murimonas intestini TaxID=1337051 RepID=UPI0011DD1580|nr:GerMN domain-containing protein [Murimonas intestini]
MKKIICLLIAAFIAICLPGCEESASEKGGYQVYYTNKDRTKLTHEGYTPKGQSDNELIKELIDRIATSPSSSEQKSAKPENVVCTGFVLDNKLLTLEFNSAYKEMDNISEVLFRAAAVKTLVQLPCVDKVAFNIEGNPLRDYVDQPVGAMTADTFIDNQGQGINSYQYASLPLYFADSSGQKIMKEMRNVHYSSNTALERVVLEQLIKGPVNSRLQAVMPADTKVLSVTVKGTSCTVNFSGSFNKGIDGKNVQPDAALYSVVNSLCDSCNLTEVNIQIDGESQITYRDTISLENGFGRNKDIIVVADTSQKAEDTAADDTAADTGGSSTVPDPQAETSVSADPSVGIDKIQGGKN